MRLLLDTHVVLWQLSGERSLGVRARELIGASTELAFSVVSFAEMGVKAGSASSKFLAIYTRTSSRPGYASSDCPQTMDSPSQAFRCITATRSTGCSSPRRGRKDSRS